MDVSQLRFTFPELIALLGMSQAVFIVVYMLFRTRMLVREGLPLAYFSVLAGALFLDAGQRMLGYHLEYYPLLQWLLWFAGPPLSVLLIFQIAQITRMPSLRHFRVLLLLPAAFVLSYWIARADESCSTVLGCSSFRELLIVSGIVAGTIALLEIWFGRGLLDSVRIQKNGKERYWLIIMLVMMNLAFLGLALVMLSESASAQQAIMIRGILAISLLYLASTSLFRIYPQSIGGIPGRGEEKQLSDFEIEMAMKIEKLLELDKVYQEASYSRTDMARELGVSEAVLSRVINFHFQKSFPNLLNERRVEDAKRLLRQTAVPIRQITEEAGFNSLASFNRVFKELTGVTPSAYRQNNTEI